MTILKHVNRLLSVVMIAAVLCVSAFAQTALTTTTLSAAIPTAPQNNQNLTTVITVASATGINAALLPSNTGGGIGSPTSGTNTFLYVDRELMQVHSISGTRITVGRGVQGTPSLAHSNGATVYIGTGSQFAQSEANVMGACTVSAQRASPFINISSGAIYTCVQVGPNANQWVQTGLVAPRGTFLPTDNTLAGSSVQAICHARYNFATDGGAVGTLTPAVGCTIPINAVITHAFITCITTTVGSTGNISVGLSAGGAGSAALLALTARASCSAGTVFDGVPVATTASAASTTYIKMTAAGNVTFSIATNVLTAGVVDVDVVYFVLQA